MITIYNVTCKVHFWPDHILLVSNTIREKVFGGILILLHGNGSLYFNPILLLEPKNVMGYLFLPTIVFRSKNSK